MCYSVYWENSHFLSIAINLKKITAKIHLSKSAYVRELNIHYYKRLSQSSVYGVCMTEDENYTSRANF